MLFLIPWPWFGPWLAAVAIATLFVASGGFVLATPRPLRVSAPLVAGFVPDGFAWWLLPPAVALMAATLGLSARR